MLSTNIFYSGYNTIFSILSLFLGIASVFLIRDSKDFRSLFLFQLGGLILMLLTYFTMKEHVLYTFGLNYNFTAFVQLMIALLISVLWINSAVDLYYNRLAGREVLTVYTSIALIGCVYYSFFEYRLNDANILRSVFTIFSIGLLCVFSLLRLIKKFNVGFLLVTISLFMLFGKLTVSAFFYQYNWLNLNIFNWLWIYVFAVAVVFMKFDMYKEELQKSWNSLDKLNLQITSMIDSAPYPIIITKRDDNKLLFINHNASALLGIGKKELAYYSLSDFMIDTENRQKFLTAIQDKKNVVNFDVMVCNIVSSSPFWLMAGSKVIEYKNSLANYISLHDINQHKQRAANQNIADIDQLTSVWNRRYFEQFVPKKIKESIQANQNFSFLLLDVDNFKKINTQYGHRVGDKFLAEIANICSNSLREDDLVARYGGEEFIIFLNDTESKSAQRVAERLRKNIENNVFKDEDNENVKITVSIGLVSSEKTSSLEILLRQVDDAMNLAKKLGRNQVALYDETAVKNTLKRKVKKSRRDIHPVFENEDSEEISLLGSFDNKIL